VEEGRGRPRAARALRNRDHHAPLSGTTTAAGLASSWTELASTTNLLNSVVDVAYGPTVNASSARSQATSNSRLATEEPIAHATGNDHTDETEQPMNVIAIVAETLAEQAVR
jgi:hypothetical protein